MIRSVAARCESLLRCTIKWDSGKILSAHDAGRVVTKMMSAADIDGLAYQKHADRSIGDFGKDDGPARQIAADRVALPAQVPFFDPVPDLLRLGASRAAEVYRDPNVGAADDGSQPVPRAELRRCSLITREQEKALATRMDRVGMLGLVREKEVTRPGGIFGVDKKRDPLTVDIPLRLIFDRSG